MDENIQTPQLNNEKNSSEKPYNLEPNIEAALSYFLTPFSGILVFMLEKEDKFVRFHAFQSILFGVAALGAWSVASALTVILIGFVLMPLVSVASVVLWFVLMYKAYSKEEFELPFIGKIAKDQVYKQ